MKQSERGYVVQGIMGYVQKAFICDPTPANEALCGKISQKLCLKTNFDINSMSS